jgi:hypothetical protein
MAIYNMTYVNQNQINYGANGYGAFSLSNNGTSYQFTPEGGGTEFGIVQYSVDGNDGIYTLQDATFTKDGVDYSITANGAFVRSLNNVLPNATGGTWTLEGGLPTMSPVVPINTIGNTYNLTWGSNSASIIDSSGTFIFNITSRSYEFLPTGGGQRISGTTTMIHYFNGVEIYTLSGHKGFVKHVGLYTAENRGIWTYQGFLPLQVLDLNIDTKMGDNYYEEDLTTNVKKYFAEAFSFDANNFEMDGSRVVGLKQSFIDSLATDLTNIVNTSIKTATLEADNATINQTLTALGINTDLLKTKDLRLVDAEGHEHKLHLGN